MPTGLRTMLARRATETTAHCADRFHPERRLMYDATFDHSRDRRLLWVARAIALIAIGAVAGSAEAQMPGARCCRTRGRPRESSARVNFAGGSGRIGVRRSRGSGRRLGPLSAQRRCGLSERAPTSTARAVYGARRRDAVRRSVELLRVRARSPGLAADRREAEGRRDAGSPTSSRSTIPCRRRRRFHLARRVGYRRTIGSNHGISLYATPAWVIYSGGTKTDGLFRAAIGADIGITQSHWGDGRRRFRRHTRQGARRPELGTVWHRCLVRLREALTSPSCIR